MVGTSPRRLDDERLLTGGGAYVADIRLEGTLEAAFLRSPYALAEVLALDIAAAGSASGVALVLTATDLPAGACFPQMTIPDPAFTAAFNLRQAEAEAPVLAGARTRYVGEPLAMVVASSRALAEDAVELIRLEAEPLEAVVEPGPAPELYQEVPGNVAATVAMVRDNAAERAATGPIAATVSGVYRFGRSGGVPLETRGVLASPRPEGGITIWTSTQLPHRVRSTIAKVLGWEESMIRVITPDVGGGFGAKASVYSEEILVPLAAHRLGRPVRWIEDRSENLVATTQSRDQVREASLSVDADGRVVEYRDSFTVNLGAFNLWTLGVVANTAVHAIGPYRIPLARVEGRACLTDKAPTAQYRGAGRPEAVFALERSLDKAARAIGMDPFELRSRNLIRPDEMPYPVGLPYRDGVAIEYDGGDYPAVLEKARELADPSSWSGLRTAAELAGERVGVGCATYVEATGRGPWEGARVVLADRGLVEVHSGVTEIGQGIRTTLAQICADALSIPLTTVVVFAGDTGGIARGVGTVASRSAVVGGNAVHLAASQLRARLDELRIEMGEHGREADLAALREAAGSDLEETAYWAPKTVTWTMGAHVAVVAVQPATGAIRILRYGAAHDGGIELHPEIVRGQVIGGIAQGIGGAVLEHFAYSPDGQPQTTTMADYLMPTAAEMPPVMVGHLPAPADNPLGIKGVGESGAIAPYAAIANAVSDAVGVELDSVPLTPELIWEAVR